VRSDRQRKTRTRIKMVKVKSKKTVEKKVWDGSKKIAVILIRGLVGTRTEIRDTLKMLNLHRKHACTIISNSPARMGMIEKVKDFVTYGEIDDDTLKLLIEKRAQKDPKDEKKIKPFFRLSPPIGGFERKGIKKHYTIGGVLGYRGENINDLIKRMI